MWVTAASIVFIALVDVSHFSVSSSVGSTQSVSNWFRRQSPCKLNSQFPCRSGPCLRTNHSDGSGETRNLCKKSKRDTEEAMCSLPEPLENGVFWPHPRRCPKGDPSDACRLLPGTLVESKWVLYIRCNVDYKLSEPIRASICLSGNWTKFPTCVSHCGISTKSASLTSLILSDSTTVRGEYPWLAALYTHNLSKRWEQVCSGTLVTSHIVMTAAQCLVSSGKTVTAEMIKVGLGKFYRDFYKAENGSVIADVREVVIPSFYAGEASISAHDIGLLDLADTVEVTSYIMPACVDWSSSFNVKVGDQGHVTGWDNMKNDTLYQTIFSNELTYIATDNCVKGVPNGFKSHITQDKFCAGSIYGSQIGHGNFGAGLTVEKNGQHFLIGVASLKIPQITKFLFFTDVKNTEHLTWLKEERKRLDKTQSVQGEMCPPLRSLSVNVKCEYNGMEVSCNRSMKPSTMATGQCKQHYRLSSLPDSTTLMCQLNGEWNYPLFYCTPDCGVSMKSRSRHKRVINGSPTHGGKYPWLAAVYFRSESNQWQQKCAGTLITSHLVLTAAHCLELPEGIVSTENIRVGLGKYHRNYYKEEPYSIIADVREVVISRYYAGAASFYALDIGLIDLVHNVQVTSHIMPACVDWTSSVYIKYGDVGHVAGWGTMKNGTASDTVLSIDLTYIGYTACINRVPQALKSFVTHDKLCLVSSDGSQVNENDSGGGLTFISNGTYYVIGVVSTNIIGATSLSLFTDITNVEHDTWLEEQKTRLDRLHLEL